MSTSCSKFERICLSLFTLIDIAPRVSDAQTALANSNSRRIGLRGNFSGDLGILTTRQPFEGRSIRAPVSQQLPQRGSFPKALVAFRAARLHDCVAQLRGIASAEAAALRARALLRLKAPARALSGLIVDDAMTSRDRGEFALLQAVASSRIGGDDVVDAAIREALVRGASSPDPTLESETEFYRAMMSFGNGDRNTAEAACERALDVAASRPALREYSGSIPLAHVVSRSQELLGIIAAADGDCRKAQRYARAALATLDASDTPDAYQEAVALKNLSIHASDFDLTKDAERLTNRVSSFAWTQDIAHVQFATLETLGWCAALHGDVPGALRSFRSAADAASIAPEFATIAASRALVARELGYHDMAVEEVDYALEQAAGYDWNRAPGDYRMGLLWIAQVAAAIVPIRARRMLDVYARVRTAMDPAFASPTDPRNRALEAYAHGLVLRAEGRLDASAESLKDAFVTWTRFGYEWRAARAAHELAELGAGDVFRSAVRRDVAQRPTSVFAKRARLVA